MKNRRFCRLSAIAFAMTLSGAFLAAGDSPAQAASPAGPNDSRFGTTLLYEVVAEKDKVDPATVETAVRVLDRRVNTSWWPAARIRRTASGQIEVGIYSQDAAKARHIQDLVQRNGTLEFRILANSHDHQKLIDRARNEPKSKELKDEKGTVLARWIVVRPKDAETFKYGDIATRAVAGGGVEVLVVNDRFNVNGTYLKEVSSATSAETGNPEISFTFDTKGGELFGEFTGENVPVDRAPGESLKRRLGIILDDHVITAPTLQSRITDRGRITGNFTREEVDDIVAVLRSGTLPCKIKLVFKQENQGEKK
jgi:SecD/SecF fusion protein